MPFWSPSRKSSSNERRRFRIRCKQRRCGEKEERIEEENCCWFVVVGDQCCVKDE